MIRGKRLRGQQKTHTQPGSIGTSTHFGWVSDAMISTGRRWVIGASSRVAGGSFCLPCHAHAETSGVAKKIAIRAGFRGLRSALMDGISINFSK
jgi:hypothetical protein